MLNHQNGVNIEEIFEENLRSEITILLQNNQNEHIVFLKNTLKKNLNISKQLPVLVEYGLTHVKDKGTDFALANYFFILSGIKNIHSDTHSFFTDMMIFCEEDEYTALKNISEIKNYYNKKILPLL